MDLSAQDINRAKKIVDTLASPVFQGRGYVQSGDSLAAEYISRQFQSIGLKPLETDYFQHFVMPVNTFPGNMSVKVNGKKLQTGKDFILDADSKGIKGKFKIVFLDSSIFLANADIPKIFPAKKERMALAYPSSWERSLAKLPPPLKEHILKFPVLLQINKKKLTFTVLKEESSQCKVEILATSFPKKAKSIQLDIENKFIPDHLARNVIGYIEGTEKKDSFLLLTAHYDHLGHLGKEAYFPGANDNASGVAMLLELARYYALPENRLPYSILFIGFAAEEAGLVGSRYYVEHPQIPLPSIKFMLNLDLMGSGKDGITVVNGSIFPKEFSVLDSLNKANTWFPKIVPRGKAANSDHYFFTERGVPAFFMYTLGEITAYHDIYDTSSVVTFSKFKEAFGLITGFFSKFE